STEGLPVLSPRTHNHPANRGRGSSPTREMALSKAAGAITAPKQTLATTRQNLLAFTSPGFGRTTAALFAAERKNRAAFCNELKSTFARRNERASGYLAGVRPLLYRA